MKRLALFVVVASALTIGPSTVQSQAPGRLSPAEALKLLKSNNQKTIDQQAATLQKLEDLAKESAQLRIFARRS